VVSAAGARPRTTSKKYGLRVVAVGYVAVLVLLPLLLITWRTVSQGAGAFWDAISTPDAVHAFELTGVIAVIAVAINTVFGIGVALLLARYRFPGRRLLNVLIDVPVSVSPIVVGLALILVYGPRTGWFGSALTHVGGGNGPGDRGPISRCECPPAVLANHAAHDPVGARLRRRALPGPLDRRIRCR
jgi:ABC-type sulfate transport system permease subunit